MTEENTAVATQEPRKAITVTVAERYGMEADAFEVALRNTVFLEGSRAEYAAFLVVCNEYKLNPLTKEIYAFKNKAGKIVPVVSIDGWVSLCNTHPQFDGMTFEDLHDGDGNLSAITVTIYRKDRSHPTVVTEYLSECVRNTEPWKMKHRMLRHKTLIQGARYAFGFSGIYDQDEAERVEITALPGDAPALLASDFKDQPKPPRRARKPEAPPATDETGNASEATTASQEARDGGEFEEGEFEDACDHAWETSEDGDKVCTKCGYVPDDGDGERPTTPAASTATEPVQSAGAQPDTSASATPASTASPETEASSPPPASEATETGSVAPADTVYTLASDTEGEDGKVPTYKNGEQFSRVKADSKARPLTYEHHAAVAEEAAPEEEEPGEFSDEAQEEAAESGGVIGQGIAAIRAAAHYPAARQIQRTLAKTDAYAAATLQAKSGVRLAMWSRYTELLEQKVETVQPYEDFLLMRMFLEFGATSPTHVDEVWTRFWRHAAYKDASDGDKKAMNSLMVSAKDRLKGE